MSGGCVELSTQTALAALRGSAGRPSAFHSSISLSLDMKRARSKPSIPIADVHWRV